MSALQIIEKQVILSLFVQPWIKNHCHFFSL